MAPKGNQQEDPLKQLADRLRSKTGIEERAAVLVDKRVDVFRGKDFAAYLRKHEELMQPFVSKATKVDQQVQDVAAMMLRKGLFMKTERMFKKPKPGKKRLVKWPKKLLPLHNEKNFEEDHLYAWLFEKQVSPWSYFFSALALLTIMLCCMFPLAPHPVKLAAVYCSMTLIICILCTLTVRSLLALSSWVLLGRSLWLFPHLLSDDKGIDEAFWPILELDPKPEEGKGSHWTVRFGMGAALMLSIWALHAYAPDKGAVRDGAWHAHDAVLEMLNLHDQGRGRLGGGEDTSNTMGVVNDSYPGASSGRGAAASSATGGVEKEEI
ncbi:hypothetical protein WJX75_000641 [Coccomyxa subellipsoidea]|uniref:Translocation protein SEC62 n=1 Tax=Coccomyxa subellipsoidea TaxID=248742 RepID=A0ABR2YLD9_9CHLO